MVPMRIPELEIAVVIRPEIVGNDLVCLLNGVATQPETSHIRFFSPIRESVGNTETDSVRSHSSDARHVKRVLTWLKWGMVPTTARIFTEAEMIHISLPSHQLHGARSVCLPVDQRESLLKVRVEFPGLHPSKSNCPFIPVPTI